MAKYRLPCDCGQFVLVEPSQAGSRVQCVCGQTLDAPTLRAIRELEPDQPTADESRHRASEWGPVRGATFTIALLLLLAGAGVTWVGYSSLTQVPDISVEEEQEHFVSTMEGVPLDQLFDEWKRVRDQGIGPRGHNPFVQARRYRNRMMQMFGAGIAMIVVGLLGVIGPLLVPGKRPR